MRNRTRLASKTIKGVMMTPKSVVLNIKNRPENQEFEHLCYKVLRKIELGDDARKRFWCLKEQLENFVEGARSLEQRRLAKV